QLLEAVQVTALGRFLCTLASGLGAEPDFPSRKITPRTAAGEASPGPSGFGTSGPCVSVVERDPGSFPPFAALRGSLGFVPSLFRAQSLRPETLAAETHALETIFLSGDVLSGEQKGAIVLAVSATNRNTYCFTVFGQVFQAAGLSEDAVDQLAAGD